MPDEQQPDFIVCPTCLGKPMLDPLAQVQDAPCATCWGTGQVLDLVCSCGRPAVTQENGKFKCTREGCTGVVPGAKMDDPYDPYDWPQSWYGY